MKPSGELFYKYYTPWNLVELGVKYIYNVLYVTYNNIMFLYNFWKYIFVANRTDNFY